MTERGKTYMSNVTQLKYRSKSNTIVKMYPDGSFTSGRSQPPKVDKHYQPLEGISSRLDFCGAKVKGVDPENPNRYITEAGISIKAVNRISIPARQPETVTNPANLERIALDYEAAGNEQMASYFSDRYASEILSGKYAFDGDRLIAVDESLPVPLMGLSDATNCHKSPFKKRKIPAKRGTKGITSHGRRRVRCGCALLEQKYTKKCLSFLTATLPAFANKEEFKLIRDNWAYVVRAFTQELKRILERRNFPTSMVWVTEIQEDRYQNSGEVAPHLHLVMVGKRNQFDKNWAIAKGEVRSLWERILGNLVGRNVTCEAATRVERPRKSLQGEFSSYLSKGGKMIQQIIKDGKGDQLPSSYSGCSDTLKKAIDARTKVLRGQDAEDFIDNLEEMKQSGLLFYKPIIIYAVNLGKEITVGYVGWIKERETVEQFIAA